MQLVAFSSVSAEQATPLVIGETFTLQSKALSETRRINVYLPPGYADAPDKRFPVLYMPDGGLAEDFLHVAGLVQVSVGNGTMRPFVLVGIENTERRRDLSGPTQNEEDKKIAPRVGGSATFRKFLRDELMPDVKARYRTTDETAIVGESLAGCFVIETFLLEPDLFDTYIAIDPSLWWNDRALVKTTARATARAIRSWTRRCGSPAAASSAATGSSASPAAVQANAPHGTALALRADAAGEALDDLPPGRTQGVSRRVQAMSTPSKRSRAEVPECGHVAVETMPTDACVYFYDCKGCATVLRPKSGDCCVFCSYGSVKCPPIQIELWLLRDPRFVTPNLVRLLQATTPHEWDEARRLVREYAASLDVDLSFQNFDQELQHFTTEYAAPTGAFILAEDARPVRRLHRRATVRGRHRRDQAPLCRCPPHADAVSAACSWNASSPSRGSSDIAACCWTPCPS